MTPPAYSYAGGDYMYRRNILQGCMMAAFGFGIMMGFWLEEGFFCYCFAVCCCVLGCGCIFKH